MLPMPSVRLDTMPVISTVAAAVLSESAFTSVATTAKPLPASPARAATTAALIASRLVWVAIFLIVSASEAIFRASIWTSSRRVRVSPTVTETRFISAVMASSDDRPWTTLSPASRALDAMAWPPRPISFTLAAISSAAAAIDCE
jgi:hypothetical protein